MKKVLTIAGSDCSGGAGIQADLKTFSAHGVFGMSVIVSVVAENTSRVIDIQDVRPDMIEKQIDAIFEDIDVDAVKIGMLSQPECMEAVAGKLKQYAPANIVLDPVMYAKNGCPLMNPDAIDTLIEKVIPFADLLTPNIPEAEKIAGMSIHNVEDMKKSAEAIYRMGCKNVLVKGGHASGSALDILFDGERFYTFDAQLLRPKIRMAQAAPTQRLLHPTLRWGAAYRKRYIGQRNISRRLFGIPWRLERATAPRIIFMSFTKTD
ncbi:hypothetical protein YDYSG_08530 [Paenibacillus tyrfis]|nr:hypothetical protein YDYSG_08530 [Paenibacillus tyrfis]